MSELQLSTPISVVVRRAFASVVRMEVCDPTYARGMAQGLKDPRPASRVDVVRVLGEETAVAWDDLIRAVAAYNAAADAAICKEGAAV